MNDDFQNTFAAARTNLIAGMNGDGLWSGRLSSSALAASVAILALSWAGAGARNDTVRRGLGWLAANINRDGGWGDTPESASNMSATLLGWSAFSVAETGEFRDTVAIAESWLTRQIGGLHSGAVSQAVLNVYGNDRTFSAPILATCALAGRLGSDPWTIVPQLPFEFAVFPHRIFKFLRMDVVSYAIPALIAIGILRHSHLPARSPLRRGFRNLFRKRALEILTHMQPGNGGFLEAVPLTGFVVMSLAASGYRDHPVTRRGVEFLLAGINDDGSWPIDTNLSTWVTSLSVNALSYAANGVPGLSPDQKRNIHDRLLAQQHRQTHRFTHAAPGGWGWTHLEGAVPDADDTSGVLIALKKLGLTGPRTIGAASRGVQWLLDLQNPDGGIPTFCRGWGKLPFDRSCPDITAHAVHALDAWFADLDPGIRARAGKAMDRALRYLSRTQRKDGAWIPLWFGNQAALRHENPTYGTARTVCALKEISPGWAPRIDGPVRRGVRWLIDGQNSDGGWGGDRNIPSSIEETALAVSALAGIKEAGDAVRRGVAWLALHTKGGNEFTPSPIGLYFASLWYSEMLYPLIFTTQALGKVAEARQATG
jgi:squalene-hopene/tetraprenyl-beta-curcumene cyclase